ncbi:very low-density lipoprotein receptor-like [Lampetra planeri]
MTQRSPPHRLAAQRRRLLSLGLVALLAASLASLASGEFARCDPSRFQCRNGRCVPEAWRCDGGNDCGDGSDETGCGPCRKDQFSCADGMCINRRWRCDGRPDCPDSSDESPAECGLRSCASDEFDCGRNVTSQRCIQHSWVCDGDRDCESGEDEQGCAPVVCAEHEVTCRSGKCVDEKFACDGDDDCGDGTDEEGCPTVPPCAAGSLACPSDPAMCVPPMLQCDGHADCPGGEDEADERCPGEGRLDPSCRSNAFRCRSGHCVHEGWRCDGDPDCDDGSDEEGCKVEACGANQLRCTDGSCVPGSSQCDGFRDCHDGSDEHDCNNTAVDCTGPGWFRCRSGECLQDRQVCDGTRDCHDWSDEPLSLCNVNECATTNGGCSHTCWDRPLGFECGCPAGYELLDEYTCGDTDECKQPGVCSQLCINYKGGYKCDCYEGYTMDPATQACKATEHQKTYLIFANQRDVRRVDLHTRSYKQLISRTRNTVAVAVEITANRIYWSDLGQKQVYSALMDEAHDSTRHTSVLGEAPVFVEGIAIDWVHGNLYWTDSKAKTVAVAKPDGSRRRTLFGQGLSEPRAIAVDPLSGFVYWSDWGQPAKIEKAGMNGVSRQVIVSKDIEWPNGITLDLVNKRLYWVDSKLRTLSSVNLAGGERHEVMHQTDALHHPFAIAIFEDKVYWADGEKEAIYSADKHTGSGISSVVEDLHSPQDLLVYHPLLQPNGTDWCSTAPLPNGGCAYLCLPAPHITAGSPRFTCACPDGEFLANDGRGCSKDRPPVVVMTTGPKDVTSREPQRTSPRPATASSSTTTTRTTTMSDRPAAVTTDDATRQHQRTSTAPATSPTATNSHMLARKEEASTSVVPVALGITIPIVLLLLLAASAVMLWRSWKRRSAKSIHFENPVYRKTTEEQEEEEREMSFGMTRNGSVSSAHSYTPIVQVHVEED